MINDECFGGNAFYNYLSPTEDFNSIFLVFSGILLIYTFIRVKNQRKIKEGYSASIDYKNRDVLMQPRNEQLNKDNYEKLPFVGESFSFIQFFLWGMAIILFLGFSIITVKSFL